MREYLPSLLLVEVTSTIGDLFIGLTRFGHPESLLGGVETWGGCVSLVGRSCSDWLGCNEKVGGAVRFCDMSQGIGSSGVEHAQIP